MRTYLFEFIAEITGDIATIKENVTENSRDITKIKANVWGIVRRWDSLDTAQKVISVDLHAINGKQELKG